MKFIIKQDFFRNIFAFLHLCDNATYIKKGHDGYDPRKKLVFFCQSVIERSNELCQPRQYLSIDEGCITFKGRIILNVITQARLINIAQKPLNLLIQAITTV